jgi:hypothetical protein
MIRSSFLDGFLSTLLPGNCQVDLHLRHPRLERLFGSLQTQCPVGVG